MQRRDPVPSPSDFIDPLFTCGSFLPGNPNNDNTAEFCDPQIDTQAQQALTCQIRDPAAAGQWTDIDRELADQAPWVPLYNPLDLTVLSARAGNYQFNPYWELLIDQLWSVSDIRSSPRNWGPVPMTSPSSCSPPSRSSLRNVSKTTKPLLGAKKLRSQRGWHQVPSALTASVDRGGRR